MSNITVKIKLGYLNKTIDFTEQMLKAGKTIAAEIRGNVLKGLDVDDMPLTPNKEPYASLKQKKLGHVRPLIAQYLKFVSASSYIVKKIKINWVRIQFTGKHPETDLNIGELAAIHQYGEGHNPVRKFVGITVYAREKIIYDLRNYIIKLFKK